MVVKDWRNHAQYFQNWKKHYRLNHVSEHNAKLIKKYILDMELGMNVSTDVKKGPRGYHRLLVLIKRIPFIVGKLQERSNDVKIEDIKEEQLMRLFSDMKTGILRRIDGKTYISVRDYIRDFKAFWHWFMRVNRKEGKIIDDITIDLDTSKEESKFVYFNETDFKRLVDNAKYDYRVLMMFLYDSGIRSPKELINVKVSDLMPIKDSNNLNLNISEESAKTFGRKIKLMLCSQALKEYIEHKKLKKSDYLFDISPISVNKYLKRLGIKVLGKENTMGGSPASELTMYDFRHNSACYWLLRYKSESALKYRFGWKKSEMIYYYSKLLGMKDTIQEEDLLVDITKTQLEKELDKQKQQNELMEERMKSMEQQLTKVQESFALEEIKRLIELMPKEALVKKEKILA